MFQKPIAPPDYRLVPGRTDLTDEDRELIDLEHLLAAVRRQFVVVSVCVVVCLGLGISYLSTAVPFYTATTRILLDQNAAAVLNQVSQVAIANESDESIASEVELLQSEKIGLAVVDALDLTKDLSSLSAPPSLINNSIASLLRSAKRFLQKDASNPEAVEVDAGAESERLRRGAARILASNLSVDRVGLSYVLKLSYVAPDATQAAAIVSGYAQAYLTDQLESKYDALRRANSWLLQRIEELRQRSTEADLAAQRFRSEHNLAVAASDDAIALQRSRSRLRELESEATSYQALYDTFLQKYQESVQQQSFPITEARIITEANTPTSPSHPRTGFVLGLCTLLGLAFGTGLGGYREFRDRFFRTGDQVQNELRLEHLGLVPQIAGSRRGRLTDRVLSFAAKHPESEFAEALRGAKLGADLKLSGVESKVIGVVSVLPGEGKSTMAANFATLLAAQGARTLLVDGDLRNPRLTRAIARNAKAGLMDVLIEGRPVGEIFRWDASGKLAVLPGAIGRYPSHSGELLASPNMTSMLQQLATTFDYVIVDLPPLASVFDARGFAPHVHGFLLVVEWGRTSRRVIRSTLSSEPQVYEKCIGVLLNKANVRRMRLYRSHGSKEYYRSRTSKYFSKEL